MIDPEILLKKQPVCANCNIPMFCLKNDVAIFINDENGGMIFRCDIFKCYDCENKVYYRFSKGIDYLDDSFWILKEKAIKINY